MADEEQVRLLKSGVKAWNKWRRENPEVAVDLDEANLSGASLHSADLQSADLVKANLEGANLIRAKLNGANLTQAVLTDADLLAADLSEADLQKTNLSGARLKGVELCSTNRTGDPLVYFEETVLRGADLSQLVFPNLPLHSSDLRDANLRDADLTAAMGLQAHHLGGALTSLAKLPEAVARFDALRVVKDASGYARKIFLMMLLGCAYAILTVATTTDVHLLTNSATSPLPIIQAQIPIVGFYVAAPLILLGFYLYFHFCMHNIWERLATLPAELPDGRTLDKAADPWLLLGLVQAHFVRLRGNRTFFSRSQHVVSIVLAWWSVPLTLFLLWGRCVRRHEAAVSSFQIALLVAATAFALYSYRLAVATLRGEAKGAFSLQVSPAGWRRYLADASVTALVGLLCSLGTTAAIRGWGDSVGPPLNADVSNEDVSGKPENWTGGSDSYHARLGLVRPAILTGSNLHGMAASRAFLAKADLTDADVSGAVLTGADLTGAIVTGAIGLTPSLIRAVCANSPLIGLDEGLRQPPPCPAYRPPDLSSTDLKYQNLREAYLVGGNLAATKLNGSDLRFAILSEADLTRAELAGADLGGAYLERADLTEADLGGASLSSAYLRWAILVGANLTGTDLRSATLDDADLTQARLYNVKLTGGELSPTSLVGANVDGAFFAATDLGGVDLTGVTNLTQQQVDMACVVVGAPPVGLPEGLKQPPPCPERKPGGGEPDRG